MDAFIIGYLTGILWMLFGTKRFGFFVFVLMTFSSAILALVLSRFLFGRW